MDRLRGGEISIEETLAELRRLPFADLGFAKVDHHRALRTGAAEAVFCEGKTAGQVVAIAARLAQSHANVLMTRATPEILEAIRAAGLSAEYHPTARIVVVNPEPREGVGLISVLSAGTADAPIAEEAAVTCEVLGNRVERAADVGVAGLHRLLEHLPLLQESNVLIVVAGMEGALPSVVGGLVGVPVMKLSIQMTSWPSARKRSHKWEPINPAPPVMTVRTLGPSTQGNAWPGPHPGARGQWPATAYSS